MTIIILAVVSSSSDTTDEDEYEGALLKLSKLVTLFMLQVIVLAVLWKFFALPLYDSHSVRYRFFVHASLDSTFAAGQRAS